MPAYQHGIRFGTETIHTLLVKRGGYGDTLALDRIYFPVRSHGDIDVHVGAIHRPASWQL
jgi:hypothetical protein